MVSDKENALHEEKVAPVQPEISEVKIFIDMEWFGSIACGTAIYSAVYETIVRDEKTAIPVYGTIRSTTMNRAWLRIADDVISRFIRKSKIEIHCNSYMLHTGIDMHRFRRQQRAQYLCIKNADLIENLLEEIDQYGHEVSIVVEKTNEYSPAMEISRRELRQGKKIPETEDKRDGK